MMKLKLIVTVQGKEPYSATVRKVFSQEDIHLLQPGLVLPVKVHPTKPDKILLGA